MLPLPFPACSLFGQHSCHPFCRLPLRDILRLPLFQASDASCPAGSPAEQHFCYSVLWASLRDILRLPLFQASDASCPAGSPAGGLNLESLFAFMAYIASQSAFPAFCFSLINPTTACAVAGGLKWTRTTDLTLIRRAL